MEYNRTRLAALFSDHAVFQQGAPVPLWGWDAAGTEVTVTCAGSTARCVAGPDGRFLLRLPAMEPGGPCELTVRGTSTVTVRDIMSGEVWLCSGQSNMEWVAADARWEAEFPANADLPAVRCFTVRNPADCPQNDARGAWEVCTPSSVGGFTAVGFAFARRIHAELGVPVGIVSSAWGGTRIESWMSRDALVGSSSGRRLVETFEADAYAAERTRAAVLTPQQEYEKLDPSNDGEVRGWHKPGFDDSGWRTMELPSTWQDQGHDISGVFWFRRAVDIPAAWAGRELTLEIGACDKVDLTWFNGEPVGSMNCDNPDSWRLQRSYTVPGRLVRAGHAVIAVRVGSHQYDGGMRGPASSMRLRQVSGDGSGIPLSGTWRYAVEREFGPTRIPVTFGPGVPDAPHVLYDGRIQPLVPYALRGALWYQGESNEGNAADYADLLERLIRDWRNAWGLGDFPFLICQLANFKLASPLPVSGAWSLVRDAQRRALDLPATGCAVTIDLGDADDVHPRNKRDIGERLARWALADTYGRGGVKSGPLYDGYTVEGDRIRVRFRECGSGLVSRGGRLVRFAVAGEDRRWRRADAVIEGNTVVVRSTDVLHPAAVRYAWADNPEGCNLYNTEGLPASPFRSDEWQR